MSLTSNDNLSLQYFSEPAWPELLPPPYPPPHNKPYTLLISLDDLLVTSSWDVRQYNFLLLQF